jgi:fructose-bisphosphate aldolase class II
VIKMNVDTDTQYAFTRPVAGHMFTSYDGVLKVDGNVGNKKHTTPRLGQGRRGRHGRRVLEACENLAAPVTRSAESPCNAGLLTVNTCPAGH